MRFVVDPSPRVLQEISRCTKAQQDFFSQVVSILEQTPYEFHSITQKNIDSKGRDFYQYYDGIMPLVFLYRVYPRQDFWPPDIEGYVRITKAEAPWW